MHILYICVKKNEKRRKVFSWGGIAASLRTLGNLLLPLLW
jgi:hypothetical protein